MMGPVFGSTGCGPIGILIGILLIGFLFFYLFKNKKTSNDHTRINRNQEALEQVKQRFARGEITTEEYQSVKDAIEKN